MLMGEKEILFPDRFAGIGTKVTYLGLLAVVGNRGEMACTFSFSLILDEWIDFIRRNCFFSREIPIGFGGDF